MEKIRVLVADDHLVVREGLRAMLSMEETIEVVGEVTDGLQAVEQTKELRPHVVLMDIRMPVLDGIQAIRRIKEECPETTVVVLTAYDNDAYVIDAVYAGARGFLLKDASRDLLMHTIQTAHTGGTVVKSSLLREAITAMLDGTGERRGDDSRRLPELKPQEIEILNLVAEGHTNKATGATLSEPENVGQWRQAEATLAVLREIPRVPLDPDVRAVPHPSGLAPKAEVSGPDQSTRLTKRELDVLRVLALGARNKEIADQLVVAVRTVRFHIENLFCKLGVKTRTQMVRVAADRGLLDN